MTAVALATALVAAAARIAIGRAASSTGRVDHYYWMLVAEAYRSQRRLPIRLPGKYLMEDEAQAYPPLFGMLLGRWRLDRSALVLVWALEVVQVAVLVATMMAFGAGPVAVALGAGIYASAPVLVMYNTQLNSRILGDLFLFAVLAAEACAAAAPDAAARAALWSVAIAGSALIILTHKMTLQVYLALLLPWSLAWHSPMPLVAAAAGLALYVAGVGPSFAAYQFRAHWDIVTFWNRHWRRLGAHQFGQSPIYGASASCSTCFHQPGGRGLVRHLRVVISYLPFALVLPLASVAAGTWPPAWLLVWIGVVYAWALLTLFVPPLKCLGGGHLYVFNAVGPAACWVTWLPATPWTAGLLAGGALLTAISLAVAWRIIGARPAARDDAFDAALAELAHYRPGRVAVFPTQAAEAVAHGTHHAVLWGAHGYGFANLEGFFPVLTVPLANFLCKYNIDWVLCDDRFWVVTPEMLRREGVQVSGEMTFRHWRLLHCVAAGSQGSAG